MSNYVVPCEALLVPGRNRTSTPFHERNRTTDGIACWFDSRFRKNLPPDAVIMVLQRQVLAPKRAAYRGSRRRTKTTLLALFGHADRTPECPLLRDEQTSRGRARRRSCHSMILIHAAHHRVGVRNSTVPNSGIFAKFAERSNASAVKSKFAPPRDMGPRKHISQPRTDKIRDRAE